MQLKLATEKLASSIGIQLPANRNHRAVGELLPSAVGTILSIDRPAGTGGSRNWLRAAEKHHPELQFVRADAHALNLDQKFDVIILSDLVNDLWDVQTILQQVAQLATLRSRIIINAYSR